jgi:eukaryotic-like serine/threonine-protein kinase
VTPDRPDTDATRPLTHARPEDPDALVGAQVGDWRIDRFLAAGGFGIVYDATHATSGLHGALKVLHGHLIDSPSLAARMLREAEVIARLRHPSIVELLDAGIADDGRPFLVMERLEGVDLASSLNAQGRRAPHAGLAMLEPVCSALALAHEHGVIHRDIKASNVFVCGDASGTPERIVLLDFGIAKVFGATDLTMSRQALGTPACMAPEQIRGGEIDARTDVYGLGVLTYHLLTGRMPFDDSSLTMSQYLHLHARRPRVSAAAPVPARVDDVIARAMAVDPADRFPGPLAFFAALRAAIVDGAARGPVGVDAFAILVSARDQAGEVLPLAERVLASRGFRIGLDLGDAALFVGRATPAAALDAAVAVYEELAPHPDVAIAVHRGEATLAGDELVGGELADPGRWPVPIELRGVHASREALGDAAPGEPFRRLR